MPLVSFRLEHFLITAEVTKVAKLVGKTTPRLEFVEEIAKTYRIAA
jgi:hypothetical protein